MIMVEGGRERDITRVTGLNLLESIVCQNS